MSNKKWNEWSLPWILASRAPFETMKHTTEVFELKSWLRMKYFFARVLIKVGNGVWSCKVIFYQKLTFDFFGDASLK